MAPMLGTNDLKSTLDTLETTYESKSQFAFKETLSDKHKQLLKDFVLSKDRQKLFHFEIPDDEAASEELTFIARRALLQHTAEKLLDSNSNELKINPYKIKSPKVLIEVTHSVAQKARAAQPEARHSSRKKTSDPKNAAPVELEPSPELPATEVLQRLLPKVNANQLTVLAENEDSATLLQLLPRLFSADNAKEITSRLQNASFKQLDFIAPLLAKHFLLGGEQHTLLLSRLLETCLQKNLNLSFLEIEEVQDALLSPRGIKNLDKLTRLSAEEKDWWNSLVQGHCQHNNEAFDFNLCLETYSDTFLPAMAGKHLILKSPCPIHYEGDFLTTLHRVQTVIEQATNPKEQFDSLEGLDWGPHGAYYAMTQAEPEALRCKQVHACMNLTSKKALETDPLRLQDSLDNPGTRLEDWAYRYMAQHWQEGNRISAVQAQVETIQQLPWSPTDRNKLLFLVATAFKNQKSVSAWPSAIAACIATLKPLDEDDRESILDAFVSAAPNDLSLEDLQALMALAVELNDGNPDDDLSGDILPPMVTCLENQGADCPVLIKTLKERLRKTNTSEEEQAEAILSFLRTIQAPELDKDTILLLAKIDEDGINEDSQEQIRNLLDAITALKANEHIAPALQGCIGVFLHTLTEINLAKSPTLPDAQAIIGVLEAIPQLLASNAKTLKNLPPNQQGDWFVKQLARTLLPNCRVGNAGIEDMSELIVDALVDAVKEKRSILVKILDQEKLNQLIDGMIIPGLADVFADIAKGALKTLLGAVLTPSYFAANQLVGTLLSENEPPSLEAINAKLKLLESAVDEFCTRDANVPGLGYLKAEYCLKIILSGEVPALDRQTTPKTADMLKEAHKDLIKGITTYFENHPNTGLTTEEVLSWLGPFARDLNLNVLFKSETVKKTKVALGRIIADLEVDLASPFAQKIMAFAAEYSETDKTSKSLADYARHIGEVGNFLKTLLKLKKTSADFNGLITALGHAAFDSLSCTQQAALLESLEATFGNEAVIYLNHIKASLEANPAASEEDIERALNGLDTLLEMDEDIARAFFVESFNYNLKSPNPFPIMAFHSISQSTALSEAQKKSLQTQLAQSLSKLKGVEPEALNAFIERIIEFGIKGDLEAQLCTALLGRLAKESDHSKALEKRLTPILKSLSENNDNKPILINTLIHLANNKNDDQADLAHLFDVTQKLKQRSNELMTAVGHLFDSTPYPLVNTLIDILLGNDDAQCIELCQKYDLNPFGKPGVTRSFDKHFISTHAQVTLVKNALTSLSNLLQDEAPFPHDLHLTLARQLSYIEAVGYVSSDAPNDFITPNKLTKLSRAELKTATETMGRRLRDSADLAPKAKEKLQLEYLAHLRECYFRTTGLFPNTSQMIVLLLSLVDPSKNWLMRIKTGEGKSLITPMLAALQWTQGGTVDVCTANRTLLERDYKDNCLPFFEFIGIPSALILRDSPATDYKLGGINCSTLDEMALFRMAQAYLGNSALIENGEPIHLLTDECDEALLKQSKILKLVAKVAPDKKGNASWVYDILYDFVRLPDFVNTNRDPANGPLAWDKDEMDLKQLKRFLKEEIKKDQDKLSRETKEAFIDDSTDITLRQWINSSIQAKNLVKDWDFVTKRLDNTQHFICVPLDKSNPSEGGIFTNEVQQAMQARLARENPHESYPIMDSPSILASQSPNTFIQTYTKVYKGRLIGISGTPGDTKELQYLNTQYGIDALGIAPHLGERRVEHKPTISFSTNETLAAIKARIDEVRKEVTTPCRDVDPETRHRPNITDEKIRESFTKDQEVSKAWSLTQTPPIIIVNESIERVKEFAADIEATYGSLGFKVQCCTGEEDAETIANYIKEAGKVNTITVCTQLWGRGVDIKLEDSENKEREGLVVIQTFNGSKSDNDQVKGRGARNGNKGVWIPIFQVDPPENWFLKICYIILCFIFPAFKQYYGQSVADALQAEQQLQDSLDRLYIQDTDQVEQALVRQLQNWEQVLISLSPDLSSQFDELREELLKNLAGFKVSDITEGNLEARTLQFKKQALSYWEEKIVNRLAHIQAEASAVTEPTYEQQLMLAYLEAADMDKELRTQLAFKQANDAYHKAAEDMAQKAIELALLDNPGAELYYDDNEESLDDETLENLQLARCRKLLPYLIAELCTQYPEARTELGFVVKATPTPLLATLANGLRKLAGREPVVVFGNDEQSLRESLIKQYRADLETMSREEINALLDHCKHAIINYGHALKNGSLTSSFKAQGLILNFSELYTATGREQDKSLTDLKDKYEEELMQELAEKLQKDLGWVKKLQGHWYALLEREVSKNAANSIYDLAAAVRANPNQREAVHALYKALEEHSLLLRDKWLISIGHDSVRDTINSALAAIKSLHLASPDCDKAFQVQCHDNTVIEHYTQQFAKYLDLKSQAFTGDACWAYLKDRLTGIMQDPGHEGNNAHCILELYETVLRFSRYAEYQPYKHQLKSLATHLKRTLDKLAEKQDLLQNSHESLLQTKSEQIQELLNKKGLAGEGCHVTLQTQSDGVKQYIAMQVANAPAQEGYEGFVYSPLQPAKRILDEIVEKQEQFKTQDFRTLTDVRSWIPLTARATAQFDQLEKNRDTLFQWFQKASIKDEAPTNLAGIQLSDEMQGLVGAKQALQAWTGEENVPEATLDEHDFILLDATKPLLRHLQAILQANIAKASTDIEGFEAQAEEQRQAALGGRIINVFKNILDGTTPERKAAAARKKRDEYKRDLLKVTAILNGEADENTFSPVDIIALAYQKLKELPLKDDQDLLQGHITQTKQGFITAIANEAASLCEAPLVDLAKDIVKQDLTAAATKAEALDKAKQEQAKFKGLRFFNAGDLLTHEAKLRNEEQQIAALAKPKPKSWFWEVGEAMVEGIDQLVMNIGL